MASATERAVCASIGWTGRPTVQPEGREAAGALREQGAGDGAERPGEHDRAPYLRGRCSGRVGEGVDRDGVQRALPHLPGEQGAQEALFVGGGGAEQCGQALLACGLRARRR